MENLIEMIEKIEARGESVVLEAASPLCCA